MATGISSTLANSFLDCICRASNVTAPAGHFLKLHTGDPGSGGTANAAIETTRQAATMSAAASGAITNSAQVQWTSVAATETITHVSAWSASSGGTFSYSGALPSSVAVTIGGTLTFAVGDLDISLVTVAS